MDIQQRLNPPIIFFHIPNGGSRNIIEAMEFKRMGVRAGVADYFISTKQTPVAFIEIKLLGQNLSPKQKVFKADCEKLNIPYKMVQSLDEFVNVYKNLQGTGLN